MYYYYVIPSENTQDCFDNHCIDRKWGGKYFFEYQIIITYHNKK